MKKRKVKITNTGYLPNSPDRNNPMNIIPSNQITMKNVPFPILGVDNMGNRQMMMPGGEYTFPGQYVTEIPLGKYQKGGRKMASYDEYMMEGLRPRPAVQESTYRSVPIIEQAKKEEAEGITTKQKVQAAANRKKIAEEEKKEEIKKQLLDQGEIKPATEGTERLKNQFVYAMDQPLDAMGSLMQRGYVPQGNLNGDYETASPMSSVIGAFNPASVIMDVGRVGRDAFEKETYTTLGGAGEGVMNAAGFLPFGSIVQKGFKSIPSQSARNLGDLKKLQEFASQYGYALPTNIERIAQSDELTDRTVRGLMNRHNTFARGVSTNWDEIEKRNPEILRHLEGKGFDLSTENGSKGAAEYMATHIPISTGYGRADLNDEVFARGMEGLYTSNSLPTAEGYTYGNGFMVRTKRPTDFSSSNRLDWIEQNNPQYYDERLPKLGLPKDYDAKKLRGTTIEDLDKALESGRIDQEAHSGLVRYKTEGEKEIRQALREKYNFKEGEDIPDEYLDDYMDDLYSMRDEKLKELFPTKGYDRKILRTERSKLDADAFDFLLKKYDGSLKKMQEHLKDRPYQDKMREVHNLGMSLGKYNWEEQQSIRDKIKVLEKEVKDMYNQDIQDYMKVNHSDYDPINRYAHYIHLGTPGEKVLEPIQSWRITPEIWANKSRGHRNTYSKKFSAMQMGGDTNFQGGMYLGKYEFKDGGLVKLVDGGKSSNDYAQARQESMLKKALGLQERIALQKPEPPLSDMNAYLSSKLPALGRLKEEAQQKEVETKYSNSPVFQSTRPLYNDPAKQVADYEKSADYKLRFKDEKDYNEEDIKSIQNSFKNSGVFQSKELDPQNYKTEKEVIELQKFLAQNGLMDKLGKYGENKDGIDGKLGKHTREAIRLYNEHNKPYKEGVLDDPTKKAIKDFKNQADAKKTLGLRVSDDLNQFITPEGEADISAANQALQDFESQLNSKGYFKGANFKTDEIKEFNPRVAFKFKLNPDSKTPFGMCAQYVNGTICDEDAAGFDAREELGLSGSAWHISDNIQSKGGKSIFAGLPQRNEVPNLKTKDEIANYIKLNLNNQKENLKNIVKGGVTWDSGVKPGDVVNIFYEGSNYTEEAYNQTKSLNNRLFTTHVGVVKADDNGNLFVEHNVHGKVEKDKLTDFLEGKVKGNGKNKVSMISGITRPNYYMGALDDGSGIPEQGITYYQTEYGKFNPKGAKAREQYDGLGESVSNKITYKFLKTIENNRDQLLKDIPISENEFDKLMRVSRAIPTLETYGGKLTEEVSPFQKTLQDTFLPDREKSMGLTKLKDETNLGQNLRSKLISSDYELDKPEKAALPTFYKISKDYLYLKEIANKNGIRNITADQLAKLAGLSYNQSVGKIAKDLIDAGSYDNYINNRKQQASSLGKSQFRYEGLVDVYDNQTMKRGGGVKNQGIYLGKYEFKDGGLVKYQKGKEYKTPTGKSIYLDPQFKTYARYKDENGNVIPTTELQKYSMIYDPQANTWDATHSEKPLQIEDRRLTTEDRINKWLGYPMDKAVKVAEELTEKGEDPIDNIRHPLAGMYTAQAIANKTGNIPYISPALGWLGSNAMGIGHELSTITRDGRPLKEKGREALEDIFNNNAGATISLMPIPDAAKEEALIQMSFNNKLPDGIVHPEGKDFYFKKSGGSVRKVKIKSLPRKNQ